MRSNDLSKSKAIIMIVVAVLLIGLFGLTLFLIEKHGLLDEKFGDTGDWGGEDDDIYMIMDDKEYVSHDNVDVYMLAGTDTGAENWGEAYSGDMADFITVMVADNTTKKYAFYQIDRNTMVDIMVPDETGDITGLSFAQVCTAHWYGMNDEERNENLVSAVAETMGELMADHYYVLSMEDIGKINDAIGGVVVTIDEDMTDLDPAFTEGATVKLDGKQAEAYLRARMGVGEGKNSERMERQKQYMENAYSMLVDQFRENPEYINDLYEQLSPLLQSDGGTNLSKLTNQLVEYENKGLLSFDGKTEIGDTFDEGVDHEEFYQDQKSVLKELRKVMNIEEDNSPDEDSEEDPEDEE